MKRRPVTSTRGRIPLQPAHVTDALPPEWRCSLEYVQLSERGAWMVRAFDGSGDLVDVAVQDDPQDALLAVADRLVPPPDKTRLSQPNSSTGCSAVVGGVGRDAGVCPPQGAPRS